MKILIYGALLLLALAVFRWMAFALILVGILILIWGALFRPTETFGFLAFNLFSEMLRRYPAIVGSLFGLLLIVDIIRRWCRSGRSEKRQPVALIEPPRLP